MKLGIIPENMLERVARASGVVPRPLLDTLVDMLLARTIMAATKRGAEQSKNLDCSPVALVLF